MIGSKIYLEDKVPNSKRRTSGARSYYPCILISESGAKLPALFTEKALNEALDRAEAQPEDAPSCKSAWYERVATYFWKDWYTRD